MKNIIRTILHRASLQFLVAMAGTLFLAGTASAITPQSSEAAQRSLAKSGPASRITGNLSSATRTRLSGTLHPQARASNDAGVVPSTTLLHGISMIFSRSAVQQADLRALTKAQQDPASPLYHQWLTPDQFAARFGMAQDDLDKASDWLQQQGFSIDRIARSRDRIFFSGTVGQIDSAFSTSLHYYTINGSRNFAPSTELSVPAALSGVVLNIGNLDSFRLRGMNHFVKAPKADFTSGSTGNHFVSPGDVSTIYNINPVYHAGWTGNGQGIAIVGQSDIALIDIERFQTASGFASPKDPVKVLVPATGNAGNFYQGDQGESDLDLEWSSAIAPDATIYFVFTGDGGNAGVFDSVVYAIETRIAPIISVSYGACEIAIGSPANVQSLEDAFVQAMAQGQTLLAASGDDGASGCFRDTGLSSSDRAALSISYPASSPSFTGVGGTQFNEGSGTYWDSTPGADIIASAKSYIPEVVWNEDDPTYGLGSTGGGASILFSKPDWQVGVPGIPADGMRDSPDIALDSASGHDGLLFCTSDSYFWRQGQQASCDNGFRDSASSAVNAAGGTSFASPIFAGMLALINQQQNSIGQGQVSAKLYTLASNPTTYASAFHDITGGDNKCNTGETGSCPNGPTGFAATTGYDQTTGLGSVDLNNLITAWGAPTLSGSITSLTLVTSEPTTTAPVELSVKVAASSGSTVPTGTVTMTVDGTTDSTPVTLVEGVATYNASISGSGAHVVNAIYSGDSNLAASSTSIALSTLFETTTQLDLSQSSPIIGTTVSVTAHVEPTSGLNYPEGTVTISFDGTQASYPIALSGGTATFNTVIKKSGKHTFSAVYSGNTDFAGSTGSVTVNAVTATSLTAIATSGTPVLGAADNITVKVATSTGTTIPTGALRVAANGIILTPAPVLDGTGSVTFPIAFTSVGTQTVTISYPGSSDFAASAGSVSVIVAPAASITSVTAATTSPVLKADDLFTITVTATAGNATPGGTVSVTVDGVAVATPLPLLNGVASYTTSFSAVGQHTVAATYSGSVDSVSSAGSVTVTVPQPSFTLAASSLSVPQPGSGTATITVTPTNGYTGTINFGIASSGLTNACYSLPSISLDGSGPVTTTLKLTASEQTCPASTTSTALSTPHTPLSSNKTLGGSTIAVAGLLLGIFGRRRRWRQGLLVVLALVGMGSAAIGCGGGSSHSTPKGTYQVSITGTDSTNQTVKNTVDITVTVN